MELQLFDHTNSKPPRCDFGPLESLDRFRSDPTLADGSPIDRTRHQGPELLEAREIDQHATEVEEQNIEGRSSGHEAILAHKKGAGQSGANGNEKREE
jgi:hypothetical protein